ncbi:MAG: hypothetical protein IT285_14445 [Bdellovibrionales bacterium]|nr:hypothetical protein [Bdellovibrionales bacterium]
MMFIVSASCVLFGVGCVEPPLNWEEVENLPHGDRFIVQRGEVPVVVTAPHAGWQRVKGLSERDCDDPGLPSGCRGGGCMSGGIGPRVAGGADFRSLQVAEAMADELESCLGGRPYVVIPTIARAIMDFNRDADDPKGERCSFDDPGARPYWEGYHRRIAITISEIQKQWGDEGLLADVHGFGSGELGKGHALSLGTGGKVGTTLPFRGAEEGIPFLFSSSAGLRALFLQGMEGVLDSLLFHTDVVPRAATGSGASYEGTPNGRFSVRRYSGILDGAPTPPIDAIQLEFSRGLRLENTAENSGRVAARALCESLSRHPVASN